MKIKKAVIAAAGLGTRFLPITKSQPKEMLPLLNKPLIQYSVEEAVACGAELVTIITALNKRSIEDYFDHHFELENLLEERGNIEAAEQLRRLCEMVDICYVRQKRQLGLGHALLAARNVIGDEPFMLLLPDDLFEQGDAVLRHMLEIHSIYQSSVVAVQRVPHKEVSRYGIIEPQRLDERLYRVAGLIEKPAPADAPSDLAIMGRYILTPDIFPLLENTLPGTNGEIQLTDAMQKLLSHNAVYAYEFAGERFDLGTPMGWLKTTIALSLRDPIIGSEVTEYLSELLRQAAYPERIYTPQPELKDTLSAK